MARPKRRRLWVWVVVGVLGVPTAAVLVFYVVAFVGSMSRHGWEWSHFTTLLFLWQTQVSAVFALVAALIGAAAIWRQTQTQLAAAAKKDRLQRYGLVIGVYPTETLEIEITHDRAIHMIGEWPQGTVAGPPFEIAAHVRQARIPVPPILHRIFDHLYLLGDAGHSLLQLTGFILQYDRLLETLAEHIEQGDALPILADHSHKFQRHLDVIGQALSEANQKLAPIHDEATSTNHRGP